MVADNRNNQGIVQNGWGTAQLWLQTTEIVKELCRMDSQQRSYGCGQRKWSRNCAEWIANSAVMVADNENGQGILQNG
jgi:hypothetical protein